MTRLALSVLLVVSAVSCRQILGIESRQICGDPEMIDNLEDNDSLICDTRGRQGGWYTVHDETGTLAEFLPASIPGGGARVDTRLA